MSKEINKRQERYEAIIKEFVENGFTRKQAVFIIDLLNDYLPLI